MSESILQLQEQLRSGLPLMVIDPTVADQISDCLKELIRSLVGREVSHHKCPDRDCRTAFWLELNIGLEYELVVELSKFGKYARAYWKRRRSMSTDYSVVIPGTDQPEYDNAFRDTRQAISQCGVTLLTLGELEERIPFSSDELNPSDEATVGSLVFASEYH